MYSSRGYGCNNGIDVLIMEVVVLGVGEYVDIGGGGGKLQKCSFGRGSRMIRVRVRMIRAGQTRSGTARDEHKNGENFDDSADFGGISRGRRWGRARSTSYTPNPRIKINKSSSNQRISKKFGAIFCGDFRIYDEINKIKLEKEG